MQTLKAQSDIEIMADAGRRLGSILRELAGCVAPGIPTRNLDAKSNELIRACGAAPAFLGYRAHHAAKPYPASLCVSVNDEVVHGVPSGYLIREGDLVKLDLGLIYKGLYVDAAVTVGAGAISQDAARLLRTTREALQAAVREALVGHTTGDIGYAVQQFVEKRGYSVVRKLCGHGIGRELHEDPSIPNFGRRGEGTPLQAGMVVALEPMVNAGKPDVFEKKDGAFVSADGSLTAHFEHTVAITHEGPRILTLPGGEGVL